MLEEAFLSLTHNGLVLEKSYTEISVSIVMKHCFFHLEWLTLEKPNFGLLLFILVKHCFCNHNGLSLETSDMGFSCFH